jgi:protein-L-isoaspartate(D-aspartate) O-methyltransferase
MGKDFAKLRKEMVEYIKSMGWLKSKEIEEALLKVPRELFMPKKYRDFAYNDQPFPIPPFTGKHTISAPSTYALFYEPLELKRGDRFLEVGTGSGYGAALAREIVGKEGLVVTIEINKETFEFAKKNLEKAGYDDIILVLGDGSKGYELEAPYDKIAVTASSPKIPEALIKQLTCPGKLIAPVGPVWPSQDLVLIEKDEWGKIKKSIVPPKVVYVPLVTESKE